MKKKMVKPSDDHASTVSKSVKNPSLISAQDLISVHKVERNSRIYKLVCTFIRNTRVDKHLYFDS